MVETSLWKAPVPTAERPAGANGVDRIPLSYQQDFLRLVDMGDEAGPFGPRYTIVGGWRLTGPLDLDALQGALDDVVARHEALRSTIIRAEDDSHQRVLPPLPVNMRVRSLSADDPGSRDRVAEEFLNEIEAGTLTMREVPVLRTVLGRFDDQDAVLVVAAHHTQVDGWSIQVIMRDLATCYAARVEHRTPDLAPARQYREFVTWQRGQADSQAVRDARAYWRRKLRGARMTGIKMDRPRLAGAPCDSAWYRFLVPEEYRAATLRLSSKLRCSPFMLLMAAYTVLLHRVTGERDIVLPTFTLGRREPWTHEIVGSFNNFLPLRTDISGCADFRDVVARARQTCLEAYAQEISFLELMEEAPELMDSVTEDDYTSCGFEVVQSPFIMGGESAGGLVFTAMRRRLLSHALGSEIPDGALWALELQASGGMVGKLGYVKAQFDESSMIAIVDEFVRVLKHTVCDPDRPLDRI
ncbi:condensation domain-containing protein [Nonomuraea jiangxiensis]|uniref:Condensation domain-containing protein n=1 Tax=Nonomuraea jiangxiensis TaxID=633440 RepID=A0A1G8IIN3_9ACTN|nr:condensation domain-containing protein [Nonomuraea jiangxiensis]SDI18786.1 Condensation domain-containing protein [Nonomuraea jiangxiensis]